MIKNPAVIPLFTAAVFALFNVVANYGLFFGMYMQNQYLYQFHEWLCGFTDAAMEKVAVLQILCYSVLTLEVRGLLFAFSPALIIPVCGSMIDEFALNFHFVDQAFSRQPTQC